jgi:hypothetical protein
MTLSERRISLGAFVSGLIVAFIVCSGAAALAQTGDPVGQMIAPRHLHPWLQQFHKTPGQSEKDAATNRAAPLSQFQLPRSPATDNLVISDSFAGLAFPNSFGSVPPDPILAVGPAHIVELTNTTVAFYSRFTGKRLFLQGLSSFFAPAGPGNFLFDPQVTYDELAQRFVIAVLDVPDSQNPTPQSKGFLLYAVSNSSNPLDGFFEMQRIDVTENGRGETVLPDFPRMGWNANAHVITLNMFGAVSQGFNHVTIITIDKSSVLDENPASFTMTQTDRGDDNFTMVPAVMHDSANSDPMWLVEESSDGLGSMLRVVKMDSVLARSPTFSEFNLNVTPYSLPPDADQPGSGPVPGDCFGGTGSGSICTNDASILSVAWRGNRLVAAHNVGVSSTAHARWYEFDTSGAPSLTQEGTIDLGPGIHTYFPSIEIAPSGDLGMTFMQSSASQFMSMYVTGQTASDPVGQMRTPVLAKAGLGTYRAFDCVSGGFFISDCRAGDFSGISVDPNFSNMFCAANEYATSGSGKNGLNNWGTWMACFSIGIHDLAVTAITVPTSILGPGPVNGAVKVTIQNRGDHNETITPANLGDGVSSGLVRLNVSVTDDNEGCLPAEVALDAAKNAALFGSGSAVLSSKKTLAVNFLVTFNCPGAIPKKSADTTPGDYSFSATVFHDVLDGSADIHNEDDTCPRGALPGLLDPLPPPKGTSDKGCGGKASGGTAGAPVTTNITR